MPYRAISMQSNPAGDELRDMIEGIADCDVNWLSRDMFFEFRAKSPSHLTKR